MITIQKKYTQLFRNLNMVDKDIIRNIIMDDVKQLSKHDTGIDIIIQQSTYEEYFNNEANILLPVIMDILKPIRNKYQILFDIDALTFHINPHLNKAEIIFI